EVLYSAQPYGKHSQLWVASLDRTTPPQLVSASGEDSPHFGPDGRIVYRSFDGINHYLEQMNEPGRLGSLQNSSVPDWQCLLHVPGSALDHHHGNHAEWNHRHICSPSRR